MRSCKKLLGLGMVLVLSFLMLTPQLMAAQQQHLVTTQDLQSAVSLQQNSRAQDLATMQNFLSDKNVERMVKARGADPVKVRQAVANLSDEELASLSAKVQTAQADFAAGGLSHRDLTLILGAVIIVVVVIAIAA